jgi:ABC-type multidrug transport system ATPase subunit
VRFQENEPIVTLADVSTRVLPGREDHAPLAHVNLSLNQGCIYALVGPRGAGKSDLLRLLAGRLMPLAGLVRYSAALGQTNEDRAHNIGYCAQRPELAPDLTVREHLKLFAAIAKTPEAEREARIAQVAEQLELAASMDKLVETEPEDAKQRLHVALSMLHNPLLWLLDEPFVGLGDNAQDILWRALGEHRQQGGISVLVCSDLVRVERYADRVLVLHLGALVSERSPRDLAARHGSLVSALDALTGNFARN